MNKKQCLGIIKISRHVLKIVFFFVVYLDISSRTENMQAAGNEVDMQDTGGVGIIAAASVDGPDRVVEKRSRAGDGQKRAREACLSLEFEQEARLTKRYEYRFTSFSRLFVC